MFYYLLMGFWSVWILWPCHDLLWFQHLTEHVDMQFPSFWEKCLYQLQIIISWVASHSVAELLSSVQGTCSVTIIREWYTGQTLISFHSPPPHACIQHLGPTFKHSQCLALWRTVGRVKCKPISASSTLSCLTCLVGSVIYWSLL